MTDFDTLVHDECTHAGLAVMEQIFAVIRDRETLPPYVLASLIRADDIQELYDHYIAPAIDDLEDYFVGREADAKIIRDANVDTPDDWPVGV